MMVDVRYWHKADIDFDAEGAAVRAAGVSAFADCPKIFDMMSPKIPMISSLLDFDIRK